mgnify:CR=1 FL=1
MVREIKLTQGYVALVDDEDFENISKYVWCTSKWNNSIYAVTNICDQDGKRKTLKMHRLILNLKVGQECDHMDHNGINNQKSNLRHVTHQQNLSNTRKQRTAHNGMCSSKYKGVKKHKGKWVSQIQLNYQQIYIGIFISEEEAARAYDIKARELFGEYSNLNFPV